jgi:hypothetical protein
MERRYVGDPEQLARGRAFYDYEDAADIADPAERALKRDEIRAQELARNPLLYAPNIARSIAGQHPGSGTVTQAAARQLQAAAEAMQRGGIQPGEAAELERSLIQFLDVSKRFQGSIEEMAKIKDLLKLIQAQQKNDRS